MTDLSARLMEAKGNDSIDAIVERAAKAGHEINRATVARYIAGDGAKRPPDKVLRALAAGLSLDVRELRALSGVPRGELGEWKPPTESARLNVDQRKALDHLIKTIVAGQEQTDGTPIATEVAQPGTGADGQDDYRIAAQTAGPKTRANRARRREEKYRIPGEDQGEGPEAGA